MLTICLFDKLSFDNLSFDNLSFNNLSFDNLSFNNLSFDNLSFDNLSFNNLNFYNLNFDNLNLQSKFRQSKSRQSKFRQFVIWQFAFRHFCLRSNDVAPRTRRAARTHQPRFFPKHLETFWPLSRRSRQCPQLWHGQNRLGNFSKKSIGFVLRSDYGHYNINFFKFLGGGRGVLGPYSETCI
jgi:hypothetical protein